MGFILLSETLDNREVLVNISDIRMAKYHGVGKTKVICNPSGGDMTLPLNIFVTESVDEIYQLIEEEKRKCF
jgi:hypothetical protein